jgi:hypothetical protein
MVAQVPGSHQTTFPCPVVRISINATTTIYLVAQSSFTASTMNVFGQIRARRVR